MGKSNRERRAAKKRQSERRYSEQRASNGSRSGTTAPMDLRWVLLATASATGPRAALPEDMWWATSAAARVRGPGGTALVVDELFCDCLESVWAAGWQPAEVVRAVRRRREAGHANLICTAVAASHSTMTASPPEPWAEQLADLGATDPWWGRGRDWLGPWALRHGTSWEEALRIAVETLSVLMHLPPSEALMPTPSEWAATAAGGRRRSTPVDDAILTKVRALLAKAESTNFEHEADALTAKAQELMARHAIDEAVANSGRAEARDTPVARRLPVDDPYAGPKSKLLGIIASANGVRAVWDQYFAMMTIVGFEADLDAVEVLFTSLLMQASRSMLSKGAIRDQRGHSRTRSFRQSFFVAFAERIHERLVMAAQQARQTAEHDLGRSLLPVLAGRKDEVDDFTTKLFPHLTRAKAASVTNRDGWLAGRAAAEMATLGPVQERLDGTTG